MPPMFVNELVGALVYKGNNIHCNFQWCNIVLTAGGGQGKCTRNMWHEIPSGQDRLSISLEACPINSLSSVKTTMTPVPVSFL